MVVGCDGVAYKVGGGRVSRQRDMPGVQVMSTPAQAPLNEVQ